MLESAVEVQERCNTRAAGARGLLECRPEKGPRTAADRGRVLHEIIDYRELVSAMVWKFRGLTDEIHKSISWQTTAGDEHSIQKHKTTAGDEHSIQKRKTTAGDEHSIPKHSRPLCQDLSGTAK